MTDTNYKAYATLDKSKWHAGEWQYEPDKVQWIDAATGLDCLAVRHESLGHWCGYVGVGPEHQFHGKDYDEVGASVHGGLTYADGCDEEGDEARAVCHIPAEGRPDNVWWLGFDCAHCDDLSPGLQAINMGVTWGEYRTFEYVKAECEQLALQLIAH